MSVTAALPTGLAPAHRAWREFEAACDADAHAEAAAALWLTMHRLGGAWLEVADNDDAASEWVLHLMGISYGLGWLGLVGFDAEQLGRLRTKYHDLLLLSLHLRARA